MYSRTKRLILRDLELGDLHAMHAFRSDPVAPRHTDIGSASLAQTEAWPVETIFHNNQRPRSAHNSAIVLCSSADVIGWIGSLP